MHFRKKVLKLQEKGESYAKLGERFKISATSISRWKKEIRPNKNRDKPWKKLNKEKLLEDIIEHPDSYIHERAKRLGVRKSWLHDALKSLGVTYKKNSKSSKSGSRKKIYVLPQNRTI